MMKASPFYGAPRLAVTEFGIAAREDAAICGQVFDKTAFLAAVLAKAGKQVTIAKALGLPSSRIAEIYSGKRRLTMEEGMKLSEAFGVPVGEPLPAPEPEPISAETLTTILKVSLRHTPEYLHAWDDHDFERLAQSVALGLELARAGIKPAGPDRHPVGEPSQVPLPLRGLPAPDAP